MPKEIADRLSEIWIDPVKKEKFIAHFENLGFPIKDLQVKKCL